MTCKADLPKLKPANACKDGDKTQSEFKIG